MQDRVAKPRTAVIAMSALAAILMTVNGLDFPLSVRFVVRETGHTYLDMCAFCSARSVIANLQALGERGRLLQALMLATIDVVIPLSACIAGTSAIGALRRGVSCKLAQVLIALPFAAYIFDLSENGLIVGLLLQYPRPSPTLAGLVGLVAGVKFIAYGGVVSAIALLGITRLVGARSPPRQRHGV